MTGRRRLAAGALLCTAVAALALATYSHHKAVSATMIITCALALTWAYVLVSNREDPP